MGCSTHDGNQSTQASGKTPAVQTASITETVLPSATPTQVLQNVILVVPASADPIQAASVKAKLQTLVTNSGVELVEKTELAANDLASNVKIVVGLAPDIGMADLAKANPAIQFVAIGVQGLQTTNNLSVIGPEGNPSNQEAFVAGYITGMLSYDWRAGMLAKSNSDTGKASEAAFSNGERFYCGLCRSLHPPYQSYPQTAEIDTPTSQQSWQAAVDSLTSTDIDYIYVSPEVSSDDLLNYLVKSKVYILGSQTPPSGVVSQWIGTILPDPGSALESMWSDLLSGKGGTQVAMPLVVTDTSSGLLDAARLRLVENIMSELSSGLIDPNA